MRYCRLRSKVCLTFVRPTFVGDRLKESAPNFPRAAFDWCGWIGKLSRLVGVGYVADCVSSSAKNIFLGAATNYQTLYSVQVKLLLNICLEREIQQFFIIAIILGGCMLKIPYKTYFFLMIHFKFLMYKMVFCQTSKLLRDQWGLLT